MVTAQADLIDIRVVSAGGEYMESVTLVAWHKAVGDTVAVGEVVATVETAKAATDIEAEVAGTLTEISAEIGLEVDVGGVIGRLAPLGASPRTETPSTWQTKCNKPEPTIERVDPVLPGSPSPGQAVNRIIASPRAHRLAKTHSLPLSDVRPSSRSGRIKGHDVEAALASRRQADGSTTSLHVRRRPGNLAPIVFIHGFGSDGRTWNPLMAALRTGHPMITVDLPGHGLSPRDPVSSIAEIADHVASALSAEGVSDAHLVGHSLGGAVAIALAKERKLNVRSLGLVSPAGLGKDMDGEFAAAYPRADTIDEMRRWLLRLFANASFVTEDLAALTLEARSDGALRDYQAQLSALLFPDGRQATNLSVELGGFHGPRRIIWGLEDRIIPWQQVLSLDGRTALNLLPNVGHMPQLEATAVVADLIAETVRSAQ